MNERLPLRVLLALGSMALTMYLTTHQTGTHRTQAVQRHLRGGVLVADDTMARAALTTRTEMAQAQRTQSERASHREFNAATDGEMGKVYFQKMANDVTTGAERIQVTFGKDLTFVLGFGDLSQADEYTMDMNTGRREPILTPNLGDQILAHYEQNLPKGGVPLSENTNIQQPKLFFNGEAQPVGVTKDNATGKVYFSTTDDVYNDYLWMVAASKDNPNINWCVDAAAHWSFSTPGIPLPKRSKGYIHVFGFEDSDKVYGEQNCRVDIGQHPDEIEPQFRNAHYIIARNKFPEAYRMYEDRQAWLQGIPDSYAFTKNAQSTKCGPLKLLRIYETVFTGKQLRKHVWEEESPSAIVAMTGVGVCFWILVFVGVWVWKLWFAAFGGEAGQASDYGSMGNSAV